MASCQKKWQRGRGPWIGAVLHEPLLSRVEQRRDKCIFSKAEKESDLHPNVNTLDKMFIARTINTFNIIYP